MSCSIWWHIHLCRAQPRVLHWPWLWRRHEMLSTVLWTSLCRAGHWRHVNLCNQFNLEAVRAHWRYKTLPIKIKDLQLFSNKVQIVPYPVLLERVHLRTCLQMYSACPPPPSPFPNVQQFMSPYFSVALCLSWVKMKLKLSKHLMTG